VCRQYQRRASIGAAIKQRLRPSCFETWLGLGDPAQSRHRPRRELQRLPSRDGSGALPRLLIVADAREPATQLDGSRELATPIERGADCSGLFFGDSEHLPSMEMPAANGK
jgi:hypothetical protein